MEKINTIDFLNYIYKNAEMGIIGIDDVITKIMDVNLEKVLKKERKEYEKICLEASHILDKYDEDNNEVGIMAKVSSKVVSEINLLKEHKTSQVAKMMIEGTTKGVVALIEKMNAYDEKDKDLVILANKFLDTLENNIEELKKYL